jgi:hypothetical protein
MATWQVWTSTLYQTEPSMRMMFCAQTQIDYKIELLILKIQSLFDFKKDEAIIPGNIIYEGYKKN